MMQLEKLDLLAYNHNSGDIDKRNLCTGGYTNNPHRNHNYNKNNTFGNHKSPSTSDYCASASENNTTDNCIPGEDITPHCNCHYNRINCHYNGNRNDDILSNIMLGNINILSFDNCANA